MMEYTTIKSEPAEHLEKKELKHLLYFSHYIWYNLKQHTVTLGLKCCDTLDGMVLKESDMTANVSRKSVFILRLTLSEITAECGVA